MLLSSGLRRAVTVALLAAVVLIALLGSVTVASASADDRCDDVGACFEHEQGSGVDDPMPADPCLQDHGCGGGGALSTGLALAAVAAAGDAGPGGDDQAAVAESTRVWSPSGALLVGGIERPPRLAP